MDGVPMLAIDPKGDLGNLLLTFPEPRAGRFPAWIDERGSRAPGHHASTRSPSSRATAWKKGLGAWGQDGARISEACATPPTSRSTRPGSRAGRAGLDPRVVRAPSEEEREDEERMAEAVTTTATSVLTLLGVDADPVQSREHILLSAILHDAWQQGPGPRSRRPHPRRSAAAVLARRRARSRSVLSGEGALRAGDAR